MPLLCSSLIALAATRSDQGTAWIRRGASVSPLFPYSPGGQVPQSRIGQAGNPNDWFWGMCSNALPLLIRVSSCFGVLTRPTREKLLDFYCHSWHIGPQQFFWILALSLPLFNSLTLRSGGVGGCCQSENRNPPEIDKLRSKSPFIFKSCRAGQVIFSAWKMIRTLRSNRDFLGTPN